MLLLQSRLPLVTCPHHADVPKVKADATPVALSSQENLGNHYGKSCPAAQWFVVLYQPLTSIPAFSLLVPVSVPVSSRTFSVLMG